MNRDEIIIPMSSSDGSSPRYASEGSSGADLSALLSEPVTLPPGGRAVIPTGIRLEIPEGFEGQVRPRSGLAARHGITVLNTPGTIDSDYRGEIKVIMINLGEESYTIQSGDRIAQFVIAPVTHARYIRQVELRETVRGEGGFGSTGT